ATTLAMQRYEGAQITNSNSYSNKINYFENRNNYRMPAYHRLDIGLNFHRKKKHGTRTWSIGFYNLYNHLNPFMVYEGTEDNPNYNSDYNVSSVSQSNVNYGRYRRVLKQISIFPIIPSISYSYKF
ncbi:MAG: hypothetical protein LBB41_06295, partial [Prevotellaceae bacterium]|nr:hypothetical protein [Prevotellaceae bacterium]